MANEIFLSYRRSDSGGHARSLHEYLQSCFESDTVFFDRDSIHPGEDFPKRLASAVTNAAAVLVLIGPDWLPAANAQGQRRLHEASDFVRTEVAMALRLRRPLLPVLFDGAHFPQAADLPADLVRLCDLDMQAIGGKTAEFRSQRLAVLEWLSAQAGVPRPVSGPRTKQDRKSITPEKLPYLCDRSMQSTQAREALHTHVKARAARPLLLVVHGDASERHDAFVERLHEFELPRVFSELRLRLQPRLLHCNEALLATADHARFAADLRSQVANELGVPPWPDDAAMTGHLARTEPDGVLAVFTWLSSECRRQPQEAVAAFFAFWSELPDFAQPGLLTIVLCLKYNEPAPARLWQALRARARLGGAAQHPLESAAASAAGRAMQAGRVGAAVLPRLRPVKVDDLQKWAPFARQHTHNLRLSDDRIAKVLQGRAELPMDLVLPGLDELLKTS